MIIPYQNTFAVPALDLVPKFYNSIKTIQSALRDCRHKDYGLKKLCSGGRGRQLLLAYDSLPAHIKQEIGDPRAVSHLLDHYFSYSDDAMAYYSSYTYGDGQHLALESIEAYVLNASVLIAAHRMHDDRVRMHQGRNRGLLAITHADVLGYNDTLHVKLEARHTLPTSLKRFKMAFEAFRKEDGAWHYESLISKKVGNTNSKKVTDNTLNLLNDLFATLGHKPTRTEIARSYEAFLSGYIEVLDSATGELYDPKQFKQLSYNTITAYLAQWSQRIAAHYLRDGNRQQYMAKYKPYHKLDKPTLAGSIISIDDRQPPFYYDNTHRMWFYMGIDLASEAWICWVWGATKEELILNFYRQLLRNCHEWGINPPLEVECESSLNSSYANTLLQPGTIFSHVRIEANNARAKRIERYFGALRYQVEKQREGWMARPHARSEANQIGKQGKQIIPQADIITGCLRDIKTWNDTPHSNHPAMTRWEYFMVNQNPDTKPVNWIWTLPHIGYCTETSCNTGMVRLQNQNWLLAQEGSVALGDKLITLMERIEGRKVQVYWLDDNDGNVMKAYLYINSTFQCELLPQPTYSRARAEMTPQCQKNREVMSSYVATIEAYRREKVARIKPLIVLPTDKAPTLRDTFPMRGLEGYTPPADSSVVEVIPPHEEEDDIDTPPSWSISTRDRF